MVASNSPKRAMLFLVFVVWFVLASAGLFYVGNQHYGHFDPSGNWPAIAPKTFSSSALGILAAPGKQVVHVQQTQCSCNRLTKQHISQFTDEYLVPSSAQFKRQLSQVAAAGLPLPAAPAVLIFEDGRLIYAGPYATGPSCSLADSLIAPILRNEIKLPGVWLNGEVKACRCLA